MARFHRVVLLAAFLLLGLATIATAEEREPRFVHWLKSKCQAGFSGAKYAFTRETAFSRLANRRYLEELARGAYFSMIEFREDFGQRHVEEQPPYAGENAEYFYDRGRIRAERGDYDAAIHDFNACLRLEPNDAAALFARGRVWGKQKAYLRGIRDLDRCIRIEPDAAEAYHFRGMYWLTFDDPNRALRDLDVFVRLDGTARAHFCRALALIHSCQWARAQRDLEQAIRLGPENVTYRVMLGGVLLSLEDDEHAIEAFNGALEISPELDDAHAGRAIAWGRAGRLAKAEEEAVRAGSSASKLLQNPAFPGYTVRLVAIGEGTKYHYWLSWKKPAADQTNDPQGNDENDAMLALANALDQFRRAIGMPPSPFDDPRSRLSKLHRRRAEVSPSSSRPIESSGDYSDGYGVAPAKVRGDGNGDVINQRARQRADDEKEQSGFGRWLKLECQAGLSGVHSVASRMAIVALSSRRRVEEFARDAYFSVVESKECLDSERSAESPMLADKNAEFFYDRGRVRAEQGEYDAAIGDFNACLRLAPKNAIAYYARGCVWGDKKEYLRGVRDLDRCIRIEPRLARAHRIRGMYWLTLEDADQALADFQAFVRLDGSGSAYLCRALAWINKAEPRRAESDLVQAAKLNPDSAVCRVMLGWVRLWTRDDAGAVDALDEALSLSPELAAAYAARAVARERQGAPAEAAADLARAVNLDPKMNVGSSPTRDCTVRLTIKGNGTRFNYNYKWKNPDVDHTHGFHSGPSYYAAGTYFGSDAAHYRGYYEGLDSLTRRRANALNEQARLLATSRYETLRDGVRAVELAREACELTHWKDATCLDTLAAAYAECGDFESADKYQTWAIEIWPVSLDGRPAAERRLQEYRDRKTPWKY